MKTVDPVRVLRQFVARHATQQEAARALGITPAYLSDILHGRREFSRKMLGKLNLQQVVVEKKS